MTLTNPDLTQKDILGVRLNFIDYETAIRTINRFHNNNQRVYVTLTNPHSVLLCHRDQKMRRATAGAAMNLPDGIGTILAAKLLGYENTGRVTGPALMLRLCDTGRSYGYRHYFYGGKKNVAEKLAAALAKTYPGLKIAGTYTPPFRELSHSEDKQIVSKINHAKPDILWVGLGAPKQEKWMAAHLGKIHAAVMIGVGAAFDFHTATVPWAPPWIRKIGFEWAYRLLKEPKRMWRRNFDSPLFLIKIISQRLTTTAARRKYFSTVEELERYRG